MSTRNFQAFAAALASRFAILSNRELYHVGLHGDDVWQAYLTAFPEGTNPLYRVRTEHDGSYDRNFVRRVGNVVAIIDGEIQTIWGMANLEYPYNEVAAVLDAKVKASLVTGLFRVKEPKLGYVSTVEHLEGGATHRWHHFHADIAAKHRANSPAEAQGKFNTNMLVFLRGLEDITFDALNTVIELMEQNTLYRGAEFKKAVTDFASIKTAYQAKRTLREKSVFAHHVLSTQPLASTLIRNSVIGTLLTDLSEGKDTETAVRAYEVKTAPTNYRRPTALITPGMIATATKTIEDLGLEPALERRFATISDVSVNNVLWVDNAVRTAMKGGIATLLANDVKPPAKPTRSEIVSIEDFLTRILPDVHSMELLVENKQQGNLVSLIAPVHNDAVQLFKWNNGFSWSYRGNITDSITEKVKAAGGNIAADLRVSLAWYNHDDLDLHSQSRQYGHIYFASKMGILDVDMNAHRGTTRSPVENQSFVRPPDGVYEFSVHNYSKRESTDVGFTMQVANAQGVIAEYNYPNAVRDNQSVKALTITLSRDEIAIEAGDGMFRGDSSRELWGIKTETFVPVTTLLNSPNFWDDNATGNKHWFFILEGCRSDEAARGIYNEFLRPELDQHRKVFEILGNKTKCQPTSDQLSGLGFSSTKRDVATIRVKGKRLNTVFNVTF